MPGLSAPRPAPRPRPSTDRRPDPALAPRALLHGLLGARLEMELRDGALWVGLVSVPSPGKGVGSMLLARLLDAADAQGLEVRLEANPTDRPDDPDTFELARWYHSFGFLPVEITDDGVVMTRPARPPVGVSALLEARTRMPPLTFEAFEGWAQSPPPAPPARPRP